jgi:hypothetical protein
MTSDTPLPSLTSRHAKLLALAYVAFLLAIVIVADSGRFRSLFIFVDHIPFGDKIGHFAFMGTLALVIHGAFPRLRARLIGPVTAASLLVATLVSLEELSQTFFPTRSADWLDLGADMLGIGLATAIAARLWPAKRGTE